MVLRKKTKCLFTIWLLLVNIVLCHGQSPDSAFEKALFSLLSLHSNQTDSLIAKTTVSEKAYFKHYQLFLNQMACDSMYPEEDKYFKETIAVLKNNSKHEERTSVFLSEVCLQHGIMAFQSGNYFNAVTHFIKSHQYWQDSERQNPHLSLNLKLKGIFNLLMSNMPAPYKTWAGWVGFSGDNNVGFHCLKEYLVKTESWQGSHQEALIYLAFAHLKFSTNDKETLAFIEEHSDELLLPITTAVFTRCAFKIRKPELAAQWMEGIDENFLATYYLKGKLAVLNHDSLAVRHLQNYIAKKKSGQFVADAYRYLSWQKCLEGDSISYKNLQDSITHLKQYPTWEDKQAKYESQLQAIPNSSLLSARIWFDAGKYNKAKDVLLAVRSPLSFSTTNQVELQYRLGRCYHMLQDTIKATFHYSQAVALGDEDKRYFAPYAALYNAGFYLRNNPVKPAFFLRKHNG